VNLLLIVSDTFRWDYIGAYGNKSIQTPALDALASESALFMDAYAEGLPTLPARRTILTGRHVFPFRFRPQKDDLVQCDGWHPLFDEDVTLAEYLREKGYVTGCVTDVYHVMKPGKNFHRGFDCWYWIRGQEGDPYALRDKARVAKLIQEDMHLSLEDIDEDSWAIQHLMNRKDWQSEEDTSVARVMRKAADWLSDYTLKKPFFLYVDCFDPHEPWDPPAEYARKYNPDYSGLAGIVPPGTFDGLSDQQAANIKAAYAGEVTLVDRWVGHLLDTLKKTGRIDDTLIIFTSDHGTMMGERNELHKGGHRLRNQCTQLPLIIRHPKGQAAGRRINGFVQHPDIMPTALNIMSIPVPERATGYNAWKLTQGEASKRQWIVSGFGAQACVRTKEWNYIAPWRKTPGADFHGYFELYDLQNDPQELTDVIDKHPDIVKELSELLKRYIKENAPLTDGSFQALAREIGEVSFDALPAPGIKRA